MTEENLNRLLYLLEIYYMQSQIILITGASSGFGKFTAQMLSEQGHIVYGTSRKASENMNNVKMLVVDVTSPLSIRQAVEQIISEQGRIDVLINNAGIGISGALELATEDEVNKQMNTNFFGVVNMCREVLPVMRKARKGKIINISSIGGVTGIPYQGFYSASKFAVEGYSEALALEVHPFNIKVCLVEPGDFNTGFTDNRNISELTRLDADYGESFLKSLKIIEKEERNGCHPQKLAAAICKIVVRKNPPFRTKVGPLVQVLFAKSKRWLPDAVIQYALRIFYAIK
jgi:NAD(P)-dependent dehydrogenase (short-subunit alcohol dehydrogenase family)